MTGSGLDILESMQHSIWVVGILQRNQEVCPYMPTCQFYSNDKYRVELHLPGIQYKCMVDILAMSMGAGQKKLLLLAREDLTNQVEGRTLD